MTKEELWKTWGEKGLYDFAEESHKKEFFEDLDNWYDTRHIAELEAIKEEVIKSFKEMDLILDDCDMHACTRLGATGDCLSSELCPYCYNPPTRFLKGYDCYD